MICGAHVILYSNNAEADRAFFRGCPRFQLRGGRSRLAYLRSAASGSGIPSHGRGYCVRALFHVQRSGGGDGIPFQEGSSLFCSAGTKMGLRYDGTTSWWRTDRAISTETCDGHHA
jgi:hypothetical protein